MKWTRIWQNADRPRYPGEKRSLSHYETKHLSLGKFTITPIGGFITVKQFRLEWYPNCNREPLLTTYHFKLRDAQTWAEDFLNGGARVTPLMIRSLHY